MLKESFKDEGKEIKRKNWSLFYNPEFEVYREKYKNIISVVKSVIEGEKVERVEVEKLGQTKLGKVYFKLEIEGEKFFIKKIPKEYKQGGVNEFKSAIKAKKRLSDKNIENVNVVDYIFAYSDSEYSYSVSKYDDSLDMTLESVMNDLEKKGDYKAVDELNKRFETIQNVLREFWDVSVRNMAYKKDSDEIILFDLNIIENKLIESSDNEL